MSWPRTDPAPEKRTWTRYTVGDTSLSVWRIQISGGWLYRTNGGDGLAFGPADGYAEPSLVPVVADLAVVLEEVAVARRMSPQLLERVSRALAQAREALQ